MSLPTVRTFSFNGPYFPPTKGCYQAASLRDVLFHCRLAMEDHEHLIGLFDAEGSCKGIWELCSEPEPDGEGDWVMTAPCYDLLRPNCNRPQIFAMLVETLK